ncbi:hypothetical protein OHA84_36425 [Streptomyces sp. NBC_00513]|uniref:hypothetical protein n=1 Tax=unclassified Streptomyces TaxID=2593676 RepID=UPI0022507324|nr:hypothetical protein [Streptomyces sp. NBC_00424]MCX5071011.1 hypothetical protein [Streptomyces sp. NBC_00424]WUD45554.1 hypothetical protein OHA84_36425 [Streptomyces sp. NBC_00513]
MAVLAGTEQAALAVNQWVTAKTGYRAGERPEQGWGSARGTGHSASGDATDATAGGGRSGALKAPGELPPDGGTAPLKLEGTPKPPSAIPYTKVAAPEVSPPKGFDPKASTEVPAERSERGRTFANPDGTLTTRFYNQPVNFRGEDGKWKGIDTSLARQEQTGRRTMSVSGPGWEPRSTEDAIRFAEYANEETLVSLGIDDASSVGYGIKGATRVQGRVAGSAITYADLRPSADVELIASSNSVKVALFMRTDSRCSPLREASLSGAVRLRSTSEAGYRHVWSVR